MSDKGVTCINVVFNNSIELGFTILPMMSTDYKERFKAEYNQVCIRARRLKQMLQDWEAGRLTFKPNCPKDLLIRQLEVMVEYSAILEERALLEGVEL